METKRAKAKRGVLNPSDQTPASPLDNKVLRGRNGRLFLDNDTNFVLAQHSGKLRFSEAQLRQWRFVLETRRAWLERFGAKHYFLVPPNAHSVYPEDLPAGHEMSHSRPVVQLMEYLETVRSYADLIYPLDELVAQRASCIFSKTETHWSEVGALIAYRHLMTDIGETYAARMLQTEALQVIEKDFVGDLGAKVIPAESAPLPFVRLTDERAELVSDNRVMNQGRRIGYRCAVAPATRCLVYGDSFAERLLPFLAETFGHTVFAEIPTLDYCLVEREMPDLVIGVMNERFMISPPNDLDAPTLDELAAVKQAAGKVYPPRNLPGTRVDSPTPGVGGISAVADRQPSV